MAKLFFLTFYFICFYYAYGFKATLNEVTPVTFQGIGHTFNNHKLYFRNNKNNVAILKSKKALNPLFNTFEDVKKIAAKELSIEESKINMESNFTKDLGADSLDLVQMIMALEEKFGITISDAEAMKLKTVKDAVEFIDKNKKQ